MGAICDACFSIPHQLAAENLFAVFPGDLTVSGLDLKSIFRYRWAVKQKIVEGGLFQWLRP
jgi:hypothetical protein